MSWRDDPGHHLWRELDRREIARTSIFTVSVSRRIDGERQEGEFVLIEAPEWVTVIPLIEEPGRERQFLMVRQFRHGSGEITVEFPAGAVNPGEEPAAAAARELLEETGYLAAELIDAGSVNPNPAFMTNRTHTFVARGLERVAGQNLDINERVEFATVPEKEVTNKMGIDEYGNGVMMISLGFYRRWAESL
jgi:ADP-ribose diphosphatase